ncbi:unnamed protein product, partial [Lymnaea stagnalis]
MTWFGKLKVHQCAMECLRHTRCQSFNYQQASGQCDLNNASHTDHANDLVDEQNWEYHLRTSFSIDKEALGPCYGDPCNSNGRCMETRSTSGNLIPVCLCNDGWTGSQCNLQDPGPQWSLWSSWSTCSVTCMRGWRSRTRVCEDPTSQQSLNPTLCYGAQLEYGTCELQECPRWTTWGDWGDCSAQTTCGQGFKVRKRSCSNGGTIGVDRYCLGLDSQSTPCYGVLCRGPLRLVNGVNPGEGRLELYNDLIKTWSLICANQMTSFLANLACRQLSWPGAHAAIKDNRFGPGDGQFGLTGISCNGSEKSVAACPHNSWSTGGRCTDGSVIPGGIQCNVNGVWSLWSSWGDCSVTCEDGIQTRTRQCNHPRAMYDGAPCQGADTEHKPCTLDLCP